MISSNLTLVNSFKTFIKKTIFPKILIFSHFNQSEEYFNYIKSSDNKTIISNAIEIIVDGEEISFEIKLSSADYSYKSVWDNVNPFNIQPAFENIGKFDYLFEIQKILAKFLINLKNSEMQDQNILINLLPSKSQKGNYDVSFQMFFTAFLPFFFSVSYISILFKFVLWLVTEKVIKTNKFRRKN